MDRHFGARYFPMKLLTIVGRVARLDFGTRSLRSLGLVVGTAAVREQNNVDLASPFCRNHKFH